MLYKNNIKNINKINYKNLNFNKIIFLFIYEFN